MIKFKILFLMSVISTIIPLDLFGQVSLTIEINELQNNDGQVLLEFSNEKGEKIMGFTKNIEEKKCVIVVNNLKPGKYAFKYFHDENKNENLDCNWLGIPTEGFGFSNNAKGTFGPPSFKNTIFELKQSTTVKCKPIYY
jgi:uncharacterized protein (DUF2141 family)